jgi:putative transposase
MARPPRVVIPGHPHHVTQRGNYRQKVFFNEQDRRLYLDWLRRYSRHYGVAVHAFCLMNNHVHLIVTPHDQSGLARLMQRLHSEYARATHLRLCRVGHLWQARYGSVAMDEKHLWAAMVYVEQNPLRAGLVQAAEDWKWSSARAHLAGVCGDDQGWLDFVDWRKRFDADSWKRMLELGLTDGLMIERLRQATRDGHPLGSEDFLERLEHESGRSLRRPSAQANQQTLTASATATSSHSGRDDDD